MIFYPPIGNEYIMGEHNLISFRWLTGVGKEAFANGFSQGSNTSAGSISPMRNGGRILCVVTHGCMQANIKEIIFVTGSNISSDTDERLTGYLAHKWAIQDKLPTNHPYYSAPPLNWTPEDISTDLWLDASDTTSFQYNSDVNTYIEQWSDKSGNGHHATQSQAAFYPIYEENAIFFDGDYLEVDLDFMAGVNHSAFIVVRPETPYSNIYGAATPAQGSGSLHIGFRNDSEYRVNYWNNDFEASIGSAFVPGGFNLLQFEWVTGVQKSVFANGILEATGSGAGTITPMAGGGRLLGVTTPNHDNMVARIQEMIVITDTEMNQATYDRITGYLAHKWDIQAQLPLTHVYRTEPPLLE